MATVALLDDNNRLVGLKSKEQPTADDLVVDSNCDLPTDGSYKWSAEQTCFVPLGHGFGPVSSRPPISNMRALYLVAQCLADDIPQEVRDWMDWYEQNLQKRDEEARARKHKR